MSRNYLTEADFNEGRPNARCSYDDWDFESINFTWVPAKGIWHISSYDLNEYFHGKIEGSPLTRCVCDDDQFTHSMIEIIDGKRVRVPLACPICLPEPTPAPPPSMCIVNDNWNQRQSSDGSGWFIHDMHCGETRYKRHGLEIYDKDTPITEEGFETIALNLLGDIMYERDEFYEIPEGVEPKAGEWRQYFNLEKAKESIVAEIKMYAKGCRYDCMEKHMESEEEE